MSARLSTTTPARRKSIDRLPQRAAGQDVVEAKRLAGVEQHDVEIPGEPPMLEAVVQQQQLRRQFLDGDRRRRDPVGILQVRHVGQREFQLKGLVVQPPLLRPVAAAENRDANVLPPQMPGDPLDHRRLAGAADGEIADAHHRHGGPMDLGGAAVVAAIAGPHDPAVGKAGGIQPGSQQPSGHAAAAAADNVSKCGGGNHKGCGELM